MTDPSWSDEPATVRSGAFMRLAAHIGDFSNPFYDEERQRDVWNEASAVGLQLTLWLGLVVASAMVWLGGEPMVPYAMGLVGFVAMIAIATETYARRLGVTVDPRYFSWGRLQALSVVFAVFSLGLFRLWVTDFPPSGVWEGFRFGFATAAAIVSLVGLGSAAVSLMRSRARRSV